jgi:hypothetical protein
VSNDDQQLLTQRADLESKLGAAHESYSDACQLRGLAETEKGKAAHNLRQLRAAIAEGRATAENVDEMTQWLEECGFEHATHYTRANESYEAIQRLEWELHNLLKAHPELFAEQADEATQAACAALVALVKPLGKAQAAWAAAEAAWAPLCRAVGVTGLPAFPLPDPAHFVEDVQGGAMVPRPAAFVVKVTVEVA